MMRKRMTFIDNNEAELSIEREDDKLVFSIEEDDEGLLPEFSPEDLAKIGKYIIEQADEIEAQQSKLKEND